MWEHVQVVSKVNLGTNVFFCVYTKKYPLWATIFVENLFFMTDVMLVSITIYVQQKNIQMCGITKFHCKSIEV